VNRARIGGSERAALSVFVGLVAVFFVAMSFLVAEGARRLSNISRAEDLASEAARAAAATLDVGALALGEPLIDADAEDGAIKQAERLLAASGDRIEFRVVVAADAASVKVDVIVLGDSLFPGFDIRGHGSHTAQVIDPAELVSP